MPEVFFISTLPNSLVTSAKSFLASLILTFSLSSDADRFLPNSLFFSASVMFLYITFRLTNASVSSLILPRADELVVCIEPRDFAKSLASLLAKPICMLIFLQCSE